MQYHTGLCLLDIFLKVLILLYLIFLLCCQYLTIERIHKLNLRKEYLNIICKSYIIGLYFFIFP